MSPRAYLVSVSKTGGTGAAVKTGFDGTEYLEKNTQLSTDAAYFRITAKTCYSPYTNYDC